MESFSITVCLLLSAVAYIFSYRQFRERGILLNNAWLFASPEEREHMDKRPYFRQSGIVFGGIGLVFTLTALEIGLRLYWMWPLTVALMVVLVIYAIASAVWIERKLKKNRM